MCQRVKVTNVLYSAIVVISNNGCQFGVYDEGNHAVILIGTDLKYRIGWTARAI